MKFDTQLWVLLNELIYCTQVRKSNFNTYMKSANDLFLKCRIK